MVVISYDGIEIPARERAGPTGVEYRFPLTVPATEEAVTVIAQIDMRGANMRPIVHVKGHRTVAATGIPITLCVCGSTETPQTASGSSRTVWTSSRHIARHLFQEAVCRTGDSWPGEESPGCHPRPASCTTCGGEGD